MTRKVLTGRRIETGFAVVALILCSQAVLPLLRRESASEYDSIAGDPLAQGVWAILYVGALFLCAVRWKTSLRIALVDRLLLSLVGIAVLSATWSVEPQVTLRRVLALIGTSLVGVHLASRFTTYRQIELIAIALGIAAGLSVVFALALPSYGIESGMHAGAWRGVYVQKNILGRMMALGVVASFMVFLKGVRVRWIAVAGLILSATLLVCSRSVSSMVIASAVIASTPLLRVSRWRYSLALPAFLTAAMLVGALVNVASTRFDGVLESLGRDSSLTGRTEIWPVVLQSIAKRPWLGFGYGAFWLGDRGESQSVAATLGWELPHSHNGYLDLCLDLGILGLFIFLVGFTFSGVRALVRLRKELTVDSIWPTLFLLLMFLYNFVESAILTRNSIFWVVYVSTLLSFPRSLSQVRSPAREGWADEAKR